MLIFLKNETAKFWKANKTINWKTNWKKNVAVEKRKIAEKKTKIDNVEKKIKTDKIETKHINTINKKNMKKKIETVKIETFAVVD